MKQRFDTPTTSPSEASQDRRFKLPQSETARERRRFAKNALILGGVATIATGLLVHQSGEAQAGHTYEGNINPDIASIEIYEGANIRSDPNVGNQEMSNRLDTINLGDMVAGAIVTTPDGAYVTRDENGAWFGVRAEDIPAVLKVENLDKDKDGIVWINAQRASAIIDTPEE